MAARFLGSLVALAVSVHVSAAADPADAAAAWQRVLERHVTDRGSVDFRGLAAQPTDLHDFLRYVAEVSPESHPAEFPARQAALAYYINSYNALAMFNVVDSGVPESLDNLIRRFFFFYVKKFDVGGRRISLYRYENDVIRPLREERVHFALNCMVVSCPRLPQEAFTADGLDDELERQAREFFAERRNLVVDRDAKRLHVSEILKFYREDFLAAEDTLIAYINRYVDEPIPHDFEIAFIDYNWTVNAASSLTGADLAE